jgi:hypothetical protein
VLDARGADRVDGHVDVPVGAVLEAHRHRQPRGELAVDLALGRPGADRPPGHGVGDVLGHDRVEELAAHGEAEREHVEEQSPRQAQAGVDVAGLVEVRVVDHALPADRRPRLLEVDAHGDAQLVGELARLGAEQPGVFEGRLAVVDAAGSHHDEQPVVLAVEDRRDLLAAPQDDFRLLGTERQLVEDQRRGEERDDVLYALVANLLWVSGKAGSHWFGSLFRVLLVAAVHGRSGPGGRRSVCGDRWCGRPPRSRPSA